MVKSRVHFTSAQRAELWDRWKRGESVSSISRSLDRRSHSGVQQIIAMRITATMPATSTAWLPIASMQAGLAAHGTGISNLIDDFSRIGMLPLRKYLMPLFTAVHATMLPV